LRSGITDWIGTKTLYALTYDSNNDLTYLAGENGVFGAYNRGGNITQNLRTTDPENWIGGNIIMDLVYDSNNGLVYLAGDNSRFGAYNRTSNVTENLSGTYVNNWINPTDDFKGITYDSNNDLIYLVGSSGKFGFYNITENKTYNLTGTDPENWMGVITPNSVTYDSNNDLVYFAGPRLFGVYDRTDGPNGTTYNLSGTDVGDWMDPNAIIYALTYDSNNDLVYLAGLSGLFGVYDITENKTYDLRATDTGNWISSTAIEGLTYDSNNDLIYLVGGTGVFGFYNITDNKTYDLRATDTDDWIGNVHLYDVTCDSNNGLVYLAGMLGVFGVYNRTSNATVPVEEVSDEEENGDGGGSGGVVTTPGTTTPIEVEEGVPATVNITNSSLAQIIITSNVTTNATISVTPTNFPIFTDLRIGGEGKVYDTFEIQTTGIDNSNIQNVTLRFKINISWTIANGVDPASVSLYRNEEIFWFFPNWVELPTTFLGSDSQYYYYEAVSPGFSSFAVLISNAQCELGAIRCFNNEVQLCVENSTWLVTESCGDGQCVDGKCVKAGILPVSLGSAALYIIIGVISAGVIVILYFVFRNISRKHSASVWKRSR
jgi:PGF-pre-PGF domain-containing protein